MKVEFSVALRRARLQARLSQMALGFQAGVSQRHLSFLESGRALPGRETVLKLARALRLAPEAVNALLSSAGFAPAFDERPWAAPEFAALRAAARQILSAILLKPIRRLTVLSKRLAMHRLFGATAMTITPETFTA